MFSDRTQWDLSENPLSLTLKKLKTAGVSIIDLTESNPTKAGFQYPSDWLTFLTTKKNFDYEPLASGMLKTRQSVCEYYQQRNIHVSPDRVLLTASTSEAYSFLFKLLCNPFDKILTPAPGYPLFSYLAQLNDVQAIPYHLVFNKGAWQFDMEHIREQIKTEHVKAIVLVSPNNPTGSFTTKKDFQELNAICQQHNIAIISDEVFCDYILDEYQHLYQSAVENKDVLTFTMSGISKVLALPQMKMSWIAVNGPEKEVKEAISRLDVIADTYLSVSTPIQHAFIKWLSRADVIVDQIRFRVEKNLTTLKQLIAHKKGIELFNVQAGWYALLKIPMDISEDEWALRLLEEKHVYVHPGFYFDFQQEGIVVLSLLPPIETFQKGIEALVE